MSLDWPVRGVANLTEFWVHHFGLAPNLLFRHPPSLLVPGALQSYMLDFPAGEHRSLRMIRSNFGNEVALKLLRPDALGVDVAWERHLDVLRWEELDFICKCVMVQDSALQHPGLPLLLLCRFAPWCDGDNSDRILPMMDDAWRSLGIADPPNALRDVRGQGFEWLHDEEGWKLDQSDSARHQIELCSLRHVENSDFPHAAFNALIDDARRLAATLVDPRWLTSEVLDLARAIDGEKAFDRLPVLADALMDAGCSNEVTLAHCQRPTPGQTSSWLVDEIVGKPWRIERA